MGIIRISENVYSLGVMDPSLRIFDIVMKAEYGTSYNSYLLTGSKNALIDTVHSKYLDEYLYNIQCMIDIKDIDYIVANHTEPDHSGSIAKLLSLNPKIKVICTYAAKKCLRQIVNFEFDCIVVKDGDYLDIGNNKLKFVVAPFLHWPDSMMTWYEAEGILFTCDFLGCHFCEPTGIDANIYYKKEYSEQFEHYYDCIFSPFKSYVSAGLGKIKNFEIKAICPSHGPVLTDTASDCIKLYREWSEESHNLEKYIAIVYVSAYGYTKFMAEAAAKEINSNTKVKVKLIDAASCSFSEVISEIKGASGLIVGSCTINRDAPKIIWDILSSIDAISGRGKPAGSFGSYGWSGEAVGMIANRLSGLGYKFIGDGVKVNFVPSEQDLLDMKSYAAEIASKIKI